MSAAEQWDDLSDELAGPDPDWEQPAEPPQDADEVNRRLRRLAKIRADMVTLADLAMAEVERINEWHARRVQVMQGQERWLLDGLEMWHRAVLADDSSRKTISLPCGVLKATKQLPVWDFDEPAFVAWAQEHAAELVRTPPAPDPVPDKAAVKKALSASAKADGAVIWKTVDTDSGEVFGEVVPGVTVTVRPPKFTIDTSGVAE